MDALFNLFQFLPQLCHCFLHDSYGSQRAYWLDFEQVPIFLFADAQEVFEVQDVQSFSCCFALPTVYATLGVHDFKHASMNFKDFGRTWVSDSQFLHLGQLDRLVYFYFRFRHESSKRDRRPLGMHFAYPLLHLEPEI